MAHQMNTRWKEVIVNEKLGVDELQTEIEALRNALVRLAVFVGGEPCWCRYAKTGEHTEACRDTLKLKLWPRPTTRKPTQSDYLPWRDESITRKRSSR